MYYLAIDIGASSGRHIIGWIESGKIKTSEIYRFHNGAVSVDGELYWNTEQLFGHILTGLKKCRQLNIVPESVAIDTWGVDFVLLDKRDELLNEAMSYRGFSSFEDDIPVRFDELYVQTGIQKQPFNTIYQLLFLKNKKQELFDKAVSFLMIPDYFNFRLTGIKHNEYTNATTTSLVNAKSRQWDFDLIKKCGLPEKLFGRLYQPGEEIGCFLPEIEKEIGFNTRVIHAASHDTASAFMAVPANNGDAVYISSGTWSLLGVELGSPELSEAARAANFTNEGGYNNTYRFLKNIMGLWMISSVRKELGDKDFDYYQRLAEQAADFSSVVDVNNEMFLSPESMVQAIKNYCRQNRLKVPKTDGELLECAYKSLAKSYAQAVEQLSFITGKSYKSMNIVGGGSRDSHLNELTEKYTGLSVTAGPAEATAAGNIIMQMLSGGRFSSLAEARKAIV